VHTDDASRARRDRDVLPEVPAVQAGRVHVLSDPLFVSPGPRLGQALRRIAAALREARARPAPDGAAR
jgi:hypothetical protein